jgi:hypothetical protein
MLKSVCILWAGLFFMVTDCLGQKIYEMAKGTVHFSSTAPLELISADSRELKGALSAEKKTFAFKIPITSFRGFNSPLQREHFNENYMESELYPDATFTGKIIEDLNLANEGEYKVRAKGKLRIHNIEQERIINVSIANNGNQLSFHAGFAISLIDHNIKIPRVVYDKLAPDIQVRVSGTLTPIK